MSTVPTYIVYYYYIKSHLNELVLDVEASNTSPGAWVSTWQKNDSNAQHWWDDPATGTIRSKLNGFCLDIQDGRLVLNPYEPGKSDQLWERKGSVIFDRRDSGQCLDIEDSNKGSRAKVIKYKYEAPGGANQTWTFELA